MNWKQGLIRLWALTSILWLLVVGYLASGIFFKPLHFRGDYQFVVQTKEMCDPSQLLRCRHHIDWNKPYYETFYAPGNGRSPDSFATVDEQYIQQWEGKITIIQFPDDSSRLFVPAELTECADFRLRYCVGKSRLQKPAI